MLSTLPKLTEDVIERGVEKLSSASSGAYYVTKIYRTDRSLEVLRATFEDITSVSDWAQKHLAEAKQDWRKAAPKAWYRDAYREMRRYVDYAKRLDVFDFNYRDEDAYDVTQRCIASSEGIDNAAARSYYEQHYRHDPLESKAIGISPRTNGEYSSEPGNKWTWVDARQDRCSQKFWGDKPRPSKRP
jgi:hypothetical protein